jgi:DNA-directed RNA polymerase specialized sigma24 family protein
MILVSQVSLKKAWQNESQIHFAPNSKAMTFPNEHILDQVIQGDERAFTELCSHFHFPAFKFCNVLLKDEKEAESIIRDVFAKIWEERVQLKTKDNFQSYLFMNLRNQIFGQMKKYTDPASRKQYLDRIHSFNEKQTEY